jgi:transposase InsO family protein
VATVSIGTTSEKFGFIAKHSDEFGIGYLCNHLDVSRSGLDTWKKRGKSQRAIKDEELTILIVRIFKKHHGIYGSPRIYKVLKRLRINIGCKRVARLMQQANLKARCSTLYRRMPGTEKFFQKHQNLRKGLPAPTAINQQWVADLTYIRVGAKWCYLAVVMDLFSRRIIGWALGRKKTAELTLRALKYAIKRRKPPKGTIFHTDRGVEYGAHIVQNELKRHGLISSMNRAGVCTDNAHMESFFHSMKAEIVHGTSYLTLKQLRGDLNRYISRFYNNHRLHSSLDYQSPVEYEALAA